MRKLSRKEVEFGRAKKGKMKGNLKGKIDFKSKFDAKTYEFSFVDNPQPKPNNGLELNIHIGEELLENIRKIIREELDKPVTVIYKDLRETINASSKIIDQVEKVKTKNSFVLVPKKKSPK